MEQHTLADLNRCLEQNEAVALLTVIASAGSSPGKPGAMMTIRPDGSCTGTIGGGNLEYQAKERAIRCLETGENSEETFHLQPGGQLGMTCGGEMRVFIKVFRAAPQLVIIGAGHIGLELYKLGTHQGFRIMVIDDREELLSEHRFPGAQLISAGNLEEQLRSIHFSNNSYITIATKAHESDRIALESVLDSDAAYIGMIGSRNKIRLAMNRLREKGFTREKLESVYAPMGLNIGTIAPKEIALSIISEILLVKNHGSLNHMRTIKGFSGGEPSTSL